MKVISLLCIVLFTLIAEYFFSQQRYGMAVGYSIFVALHIALVLVLTRKDD